MSNDIYIFLGPSLSLAEAKAILPEAHYLSPIRCGDILRVLRLQPKIIGIIDGYFESTAAVWHKEILYALENGVRVLGGGSMGALRASELQEFGLELVGEIARDYQNKVLNGDDEVAVLHSPKSYVVTTDPLVNIRATLTKAEKKGIISTQLAEDILSIAKQQPYQKRQLVKIIFELQANQSYALQELTTFQEWLAAGNSCDKKKEDAKLLLAFIAETKNKSIKVNPCKVNQSIFFRTLYNNVMCRPFSHYYEWLPIHEKVALSTRLLSHNYQLLRRLAYLLSACYSAALQDKKLSTNDSFNPALNTDWFKIYEDANQACWQEKYDCDSLEKTCFLQRMSIIRSELDRYDINLNRNHIVEYYILLLLKISGEYISYKAENHNEIDILKTFREQQPLRFNLMSCFASCWCYLEKRFLSLGLQPTDNVIEEYRDNFRLTKKLYTKERTEHWMASNDIDETGFQYLHAASARLSIIIIQNNIDILKPRNNVNKIWWFLDALYLTGFYVEAKTLLRDRTKLQQIEAEIMTQDTQQTEETLFALDFIDGYRDFREFLEAILVDL